MVGTTGAGFDPDIRFKTLRLEGKTSLLGLALDELRDLLIRCFDF